MIIESRYLLKKKSYFRILDCKLDLFYLFNLEDYKKFRFSNKN